jgi:carbonic anhydrase/acetyltransferase-like protein (isoleucine patch superfamily)
MRRIITWVALAATALLLLLPSAVLAQAPRAEGVLFGVQNDVSVPAGSEADAVIVIQASGRVEGVSATVFVVDGSVLITGPGARVDDVVAINATVEVGPGASVGDISEIGSTVTVDPTAVVTAQRTLPGDFTWLAGVLGVFFLLMWIGWGIAVLVAALLVAGLASAQVRRAGWAIGRETLKVILVGLLAIIFPPILAGLAMVTVVGIPLGIGILFFWGLIGFLGYLVAGIWLGERLMGRRGTGRPYAAAFLGVLILLVAGIIPLVSFIAWWLGLGAVVLDGWRVLRRTAVPAAPGMAPPSVPPGGYWGPGGYPPPQDQWGGQPGWGQQPGWGAPPEQGWGPAPQSGWGQPPAPGQGPDWGPPRQP